MANVTTAARSAAVLGATGAVGREVVQSLLLTRNDWDPIVLLNRRPSLASFPSDPRLVEQIIPMSANDLQEGGPLEKECSQIFRTHATSVLFITMGVGAPSKVLEDELRRVDVDIPTSVARGAAATTSVAHVSILTAVGADIAAIPASDGLFGMMPRTRAGGGLYNFCKGKVEENIQAMSETWHTSTFRPATLIGTPNTPGYVATIAGWFDGLVPALYKKSDISTLGAAMVLDAEKRLEVNTENTEASRFSIFQGEELHMLYKEVLEAGEELKQGGGEL